MWYCICYAVKDGSNFHSSFFLNFNSGDETLAFKRQGKLFKVVVQGGSNFLSHVDKTYIASNVISYQSVSLRFW